MPKACPNCKSKNIKKVSEVWGHISGWQDDMCVDCGKHIYANHGQH